MGQHAHLYNMKAWHMRRRVQLQREPVCRFCQRRGVDRVATVADHVSPHRGDVRSFLEGPLQSLCKTCHDSAKQAEERHGYSVEVGLDGWPVDPKHPSNGGRQ